MKNRLEQLQQQRQRLCAGGSANDSMAIAAAPGRTAARRRFSISGACF